MDVANQDEEGEKSKRSQYSGDGQNDGVAEVSDQPRGAEIEEEAADACGGAAHASDGTDRGVREDVAGERLNIADPHLKAEEHDGDAGQCGVGAIGTRSKNTE